VDGVDDTGAVHEALAPDGSDAAFVSSTVPTTLYPGERRRVDIVMRNTGGTSPANDWTPADPSYYFAAPQWGLGNMPLSSTVSVGAVTTFDGVITAPYVTGNFMAQMYVNGTLFGERVSIPVSIHGDRSHHDLQRLHRLGRLSVPLHHHQCERYGLPRLPLKERVSAR
jgi:hypothetical protein